VSGHGLPKARSDIRVSRHEESGQIHFILHDPITNKYLKLREPEYVLYELLDGNRTADDLVTALKERLGIVLAAEGVTRFIEKLGGMQLLESTESDRLAPMVRDSAHDRRASLLHYRFRTFNPEKTVAWLHARLRFAFTPEFTVLAFLIIGLGVYLLLSQTTSSIPYSLADILRLSTVALALISIFVMTVAHEFAHAVFCRHYGGRVTEMGFLLIYFQPALYCNLSESYMFTRKSHRLATLAAGLYLQLFLGSVCLILWRILKHGTVVSDFLLVLSAVSFGTLLFNLNPLIKLDGYYILSDWLGIPNLRSRAFEYLRHVSLKVAFGLRTRIRSLTPKEKRIFACYGALSLIYSVALICILAMLLFNALVSQWKGTGFLLFAIAVAVMLKSAISGSARLVRETVMEDTVSRISRTRLIIWGAVILALILALLLIRTELRVTSSAILRPIESFTVNNTGDNVLKSIYFFGGEHQIRREQVYQLASLDFSVFKLEPLVQEGMTVKAGDTLLSVSSNLYRGDLAQVESELTKSRAEYDLLISDPKAAELAKAKAEVEEAKLKLARQKSDYDRAEKMHERGLISEGDWETARTDRSVADKQVLIAQSKYEILKSGPKAEELPIIEADIGRLEAKMAYLLEQIEASTFIAPFPGKISLSREQGEILTLVRTDSIEAVMAAPEEDIDVIAVGRKTALKVAGYPTEIFEGTVVKLQETAIGSGDDRVFTTISVLVNPGDILKPGMSAYAKIYCGKRSLASKIIRRVARFFRVEFWSWW
jgi:putative peptide zinc metalloprotease protein